MDWATNVNVVGPIVLVLYSAFAFWAGWELGSDRQRCRSAENANKLVQDNMALRTRITELAHPYQVGFKEGDTHGRSDSAEAMAVRDRRIADLELLAREGYLLSTYAACIHWSDRDTNTADFLRGLKERIQRVQAMHSEAFPLDRPPHAR